MKAILLVPVVLLAAFAGGQTASAQRRPKFPTPFYYQSNDRITPPNQPDPVAYPRPQRLPTRAYPTR